jgi:hypothetical protein
MVGKQLRLAFHSNGCDREDDETRTLTRLVWIRVLVGALLKFAVIVAWKLINSEH